MTEYNQMQKASLLRELGEVVKEAVTFFRTIPEDFFDGSMTAREVVSHLLFWHEEYVEIAVALWDGRVPALQDGAFAHLNAEAADEFSDVGYQQLLQRLCATQQELEIQLRQLSDWTLSFPIKKGVRHQTVYNRLEQIIDHIDRHVQRAVRAQRRGEEWIQAYYSEAT